MSGLLRLFIGLLIILTLVYAGFELGHRFGRKDVQTTLIENYSFVREIAELASLEVTGVSTITSTNLANDGSLSDDLKKLFTEQTIHLSVPYTAKFGVNLKDSTMRIVRRDSLVEIHLPAPQLLSYELRLDRMDATNRGGLFSSANADLYTHFQKQLYTEGRAQLEHNAAYLAQTASGVSRLLENYFKSAGLSAVCIFDLPTTVVSPKG